MREFIGLVEELVGTRLDRARALLVGNARQKRSVFLFPAGSAEPAFVAKVPGNPQAQEQCDVEEAGLRTMKRLPLTRMLSPPPLGTVSWDGFRCHVQGSIRSRQLMGELPVHRRHLRRAHLRRAVEALTELYLASRHATVIGTSYARCVQHGDFWLGNLGRTRTQTVAYDLEYCTEDGLPLFDLCHFVLYYSVALRNVGRVGPRLLKGDYSRETDERSFHPTAEDVRRLFVDEGPVRSLVREHLAVYCEAADITRPDGRELVRRFIEVDRGIVGLPPGWESDVL